MARTDQTTIKEPDQSTGAAGKCKISTIRPKGHQKDALTFQEKLAILHKMEEMGWTQKQTVSYYSNKGYGSQISQSNISCWQRDKEKMVKHIGEGGINATTRCICSVQHPELEAALALWVKQREARGLTIKGTLIKMKAERIGKAMDIKDLKLSDGWLAAFKEQHMLQDRRRYGEAGSVRSDDADAERERLRTQLGG